MTVAERIISIDITHIVRAALAQAAEHPIDATADADRATDDDA